VEKSRQDHVSIDTNELKNTILFNSYMCLHRSQSFESNCSVYEEPLKISIK